MAYPLELRSRVITAYEEGGGTLLEIAETFQVGVATVNRWWSRFLKTGSMAALPRGGGMKAKVDSRGEQTLRGWIQVQPDLTLEELAQRYKEQFRVTVDLSVMCRTLARMGLSRKKRLSMRPRGRGRG